MNTLSIARSAVVPRKRAEGLIVTRHAVRGALALIGTAVGYNILMALIMIFLYPVMSQGNVASLLSSYVSIPVVASMMGTHATHISGYAAFMALYFYSAFNGIIYAGCVAYAAGAALPRNVESGLLDLALARPISRTRYYLEIWLGMVICALLVALFTIGFAWFTTLFVNNPGIDWQWLWITQAIQFAFFFMAAGLGMLLGACIDASRAAAGTAIGLIALGYLFNTFGGLSEKFSWLLKLSPFYYAPSVDPLLLHQLTDAWRPWVLVGAGLLCGLAGLLVFNRRDFPTT